MNTLDKDEAAALAKCHPDTMRKMMKSGDVPGVKIGRKWVIKEEDCREWIRVGTVRFWRNVRRQKRRREAGPSSAQQASYMGHRARKLMRFVSWADRAAMAAFYAEARRLTTATGIQHEVDHVLPLCGRMVSGLHVETNLRVIPKAENRAKGNHHD